MKLHYKGKYNLDPDSLPHEPHKEGAVQFKEAKDSKTLGIIANVIAFVLMIPLLAAVYFRCDAAPKDLFIGVLLSLVTMFPHELLHAIGFKEDVYLYTNLKQGMAFVVGPETMSKSRFVFMSLLPNLVYGFIPFAVAMIFPNLSAFGAFGACCISMGAGDYYNIFNALTQMPKGARTYMHKFHSFWYMPQ